MTNDKTIDLISCKEEDLLPSEANEFREAAKLSHNVREFLIDSHEKTLEDIKAEREHLARLLPISASDWFFDKNRIRQERADLLLERADLWCRLQVLKAVRDPEHWSRV